MKSAEVEVRVESGLHARPAARFVRLARGYRSRIGLENASAGGTRADAKSLSSILAAGVERGHRVRIWAEGDDEAAAIDALAALLAADGTPAGTAAERGSLTGSARGRPRGPQAPPQVSGDAMPVRLCGLPGAPGIAIGPIWRAEVHADAPAGEPSLPLPEGDRLRAAAERAAAALKELAAGLVRLDRPGEAEILEAQALMAVDPALLDGAAGLIGEGRDAASAIVASAVASARVLEGLDDELLAARAADVRDVGARVARILDGRSLDLPAAPSIAVARDLAPSLVAEMPAGLLLGIALEAGSPAAHVAILARSLGIPAVVAAPELGAAIASAAAGTVLALDGETGDIVVDPSDEDVAMFGERRAARESRDRRAAELRGRPAATRDGRRIHLLANVRSADDAPRALAAGAEGIGLFRTEFLFLRRESPPAEEEQVAAYRRAMEVFGPDRPVVIRLADIGGDKRIPYLGLPEEPNPFLGVRAIRLAAGSRGLLLTQLRAIWRAAGLAGVTPHAMAAMVSTVEDARLLIDLRDEARAAVVAAGQACPDRMVTGLMIEVPSAALLAPELARLADFFSIGTNDLTQYVLAADRGNPALARLQDALHPAVLRLISSVVSAAGGAGIPVAACGELAGDPAGALVLAGLGIDELSADPSALDTVRLALAEVTSSQMAGLASRALAATDAATVRRLAAELLGRATS